MPLLDHFNPPLSRTHPWRSFHGAWAAAMTRLLNEGVLPAGYYAVPMVEREGPVEIDVAAFHGGAGVTESEARQIAPQTWTPPAPAVALALDMPELDAIEVHVFADDGDPKLVAAVELASPRNKDRPQARQAFAVKCAGYLQQGCGVVVVATVTTRRADLHAGILALLGTEADAVGGVIRAGGPSTVSYRAVGVDSGQQLQLWPAALTLSQALPTLPLWIGAELSVPLDLEASYAATCVDLRVPQAG